MRVISVSTIRRFYEQFPAAEQSLKSWYHEAKNATWDNPQEIKEQYRNSSILRNGRVVFNIAGNKFRLVTAISYPNHIVFIKFVGTHEQYDAIDAHTVQM